MKVALKPFGFGFLKSVLNRLFAHPELLQKLGISFEKGPLSKKQCLVDFHFSLCLEKNICQIILLANFFLADS